MISQVNVFVVVTVLRHYVMFMYGGQYLTWVKWFSEKASLRISYVILFECKGP